MQMIIAERITERLNALRLNQYEAATRGGFDRVFIYDLLSGKKNNIRRKNLEKLAVALECDPEYLLGQQPAPREGQPPIARAAPAAPGLPFRGFVEAGVWRSAEAAPAEKMAPVDADQRFPVSQQSVFIVTGSHAAQLGIAAGSAVVVADVPPRDGDIVVVRQARAGGEIELAARLMKNGSPVLPRGADTTGQLEIVGVIVRAIKTFG